MSAVDANIIPFPKHQNYRMPTAHLQSLQKIAHKHALGHPLNTAEQAAILENAYPIIQEILQQRILAQQVVHHISVTAKQIAHEPDMFTAPLQQLNQI
jgi:hypothetical protein